MEKKMFYKAGPLLFERAKELRNNMTAAEVVIWGYLKIHPCGYIFRRQHPLLNYIVDFFCFKLNLVIEIDGSIHDSEEAKKRDQERQKIIESAGLKVIRFSNEEVMKQSERVIEKIKLVLHEQIQKRRDGTPPLGGWEV